MKRGKLQFNVALALALLLTGCGSRGAVPAPTPTPTPTIPPATVQPAEEMEFALACASASSFHPVTGANQMNLTLAPLLYQGLFALEPGFQPRPELCASYEVSEDGLTWIFTLAPATFSDGSPLTAKEVAASLNRARQEGRFVARLAGIQTIAAVGETVVVTLARPEGRLPALLDVPIVKETGNAAMPLGTGPYYLANQDVNNSNGWTLTARQGASVSLPTIPLRVMGTGEDLIAAFDTGEVSLVDTDLVGTNALGFSGRFETTDYPTTTLLYVGMNSGHGNSFCQETAVRQAVACLVNREQLVSRLLAGHGVVSELLLHPDAMAVANEHGGYDPERAAALLTEGGWSRSDEGIWKKGKTTLTLRFLVNQDNSAKIAVAEAVSDELERLGFEVNLEKLPWEEFVAALEKGKFDLYLGESAMKADFDVEPFVGTGGALNYGRYSDPALDEAVCAWRERGDREAAETLFPMIAEKAPLVPVCFKNRSVLTQWGQVSDLRPVQGNVFAHLEAWKFPG